VIRKTFIFLLITFLVGCENDESKVNAIFGKKLGVDEAVNIESYMSQSGKMKAKLTFFVTLMVSFTLCMVVIGMVGVLMAGLFDPLVDNAEIFKLISPAFQTIVGGFIGLLAGVKLSHGEENLK
jgi:uncharacterized protein YqhQ